MVQLEEFKIKLGPYSTTTLSILLPFFLPGNWPKRQNFEKSAIHIYLNIQKIVQMNCFIFTINVDKIRL